MRTLAAACTLATVPMLGCQVIFDVDSKEYAPSTRADGGDPSASGAVDAGSVVDGDVADATGADAASEPTVAQPPPPPPETTNTGPSRSLALLARRYYFGAIDPVTGESDPQAWRRIGFEVDGVDTDAERATSAQPGTCLRAEGSQHDALLDGDDGRDNAFGFQVLRIASEFGPSLESLEVGASMSAEEGYPTIVALLRGVSDEPDDSEVEVGLAVTVKQPTPPIEWNGNRVFALDSRSVEPGTVVPKLRFTDAYMTNHVVVAGALHEPPPAPVMLPFDPTARPITLNPAGFLLTFELSEDHERVERSTLFAAMSIADMVSLFLPTAVRWSAAAFCTTEGQRALDMLVRPAADLRLDQPRFLDPTSTLPCDGVSTAMQIGWHPMRYPLPEHLNDSGVSNDLCGDSS